MNSNILEIEKFSRKYNNKDEFIENIKTIAENFINHFNKESISFDYESRNLFSNFFSINVKSNYKNVYSFEFMEDHSLNSKKISIHLNYNETSVMNIFNALLYYKSSENIEDENIESYLYDDLNFGYSKPSSLMINRIVFKSLYQFLDKITSEILFTSRMESFSLNLSNENNELKLNCLEIAFVPYSKDVSALRFSIILDFNFNISKISIGADVFSVCEHSIEKLKKYFIVKLYSFVDFKNLNISSFDEISLDNFEQYYEIYKIKSY
jgi:hypothetical protein